MYQLPEARPPCHILECILLRVDHATVSIRTVHMSPPRLVAFEDHRIPARLADIYTWSVLERSCCALMADVADEGSATASPAAEIHL